MATATITAAEPVAPLPIPTSPPVKYDAFISYSHTDLAWVNAHLVPALKSTSITVCIDYDDFEVGPFALVNMQDSVKASRHVIIVLSSNWFNSEWSKLEYLLAASADPTGRGRKVLPILIEKI